MDHFNAGRNRCTAKEHRQSATAATEQSLNARENDVISNLNDLYAFSESYIEELREAGNEDLAHEVESGLRGGSTSGEILTYLALAYIHVQAAGLGDARVADALAYMSRVAASNR